MKTVNDQQLLFEFESADSLTQFLVGMLPLVSGGVLSLLVWQFGGWQAVVGVVVACALCIAGLRSSISVYAGRVQVVRKWFVLPYKIYTADSIEDISYGGDYGLEEGAIGIVVTMGGKEIHLGTAKNMHYLHDALSQVAYSGRAHEG